VFSRFCHFYSISPEAVLNMKTSMFWAMESCIPRIMSESELRQIGIHQSVTSADALQEQKKNLVLQMGEVYVVERTRVVMAEPGALDKLRALAG